jgi:hypothetical protein
MLRVPQQLAVLERCPIVEDCRERLSRATPLDRKPPIDWGVTLVLAGITIATVGAIVVWLFYAPT